MNKVKIPYIAIDHDCNEVKNASFISASQIDSSPTVLDEISKKVGVDYDNLVAYVCSPNEYPAAINAIKNKQVPELDISGTISGSKKIYELNFPVKISGLKESAIIVQLRGML